MKILPLLLMAALAVTGSGAFAALDGYDADFEGHLDFRTGKKGRVISADAFGFSDTGGEAEIFVSAFGGRGQEVEIEIFLNADGTGRLAVDGSVLADPKFLEKSKGKGAKVRVKIRASGTWTLGADGVTATLAFSGNKGKAGNRVACVVTLDSQRGLVVSLKSAFKQSVKGLGRRVSIDFRGARLDDGFDDDFDDDFDFDEDDE